MSFLARLVSDNSRSLEKFELGTQVHTTLQIVFKSVAVAKLVYAATARAW